jgi:predicted GNAT superfamily acetyltransferase
MSAEAQFQGIADEIVCRRAESVADYRACQEAQRKAWGINDDGYVIPIATMVGANLHGGMVLGAFLPDGEAVAMSFAFLGRVESRPCLYSQLTGVVPGFQSRGLGFRLKHYQRELARQEEIARIAWAFDPLQAGNAYFNLNRLGAVATQYVPNMYGIRTDALNAGVATDRLIVEWDTSEPTDPSPLDLSAMSGLPRLIETSGSEQGSGVVPVAVNTRIESPQILLEIPEAIGRLRNEEPAIAEQWRDAVCRAFAWAFDAGYRAGAVWRDESSERRRAFYVLNRKR